MPRYPISEYDLNGYEVSDSGKSKYKAILKSKTTGRIVRVPFGHKDYEHYRDTTGLNAYPDQVHGDPKRRKSYRKRHAGYLVKGYYSPAWFSYNILW